MRKLVLFLLLFPTLVWSQAIVSTAGGGPWDQTSTWVGGVVPISTNSSSISIVGPVNVSSTVYNSATPLVIDQTTINTGGTLTIDANAQVNVANGPTDLTVAGTGQLQVDGTLVQINGTTFSGTTALNTFFNADSFYEHRNTSFGALLTASWDPSSTILVTGQTGGSVAGASWLQNIGNFTFDCPNLAAGVANLNGSLRNIAGDFNVVRTGTTGRLMFSNGAGVVPVLIGGTLFVGDGTQNAALWITSTGTVTVTVAGDVVVSTTSPTPSQNATTGTGIIQLGGDFLLQTGVWNFLSGGGVGTVSLAAGNFIASLGTQVNRTGTGNATIDFVGTTSDQGIQLDPSLTVTGAINLSVSKSSGNVNLQTPLTIGAYTQSGGTLVLNGLTMTINGIISQTGGNIDASTTSSFVVGGAGAISAGLVFSPGPSLFSTFTLNRSGATFNSASAFQINTLNLSAGTLTNSNITIDDLGIINVVAGTLTNIPNASGVYDVNYANTVALNTSNELPTAPSAVLRNLSKSAVGVLTLTKNIEINGDLTLSAGTFANGANSITLDGNFISNGALTTLAGASFTFAGATSSLTGSVAPVFRNLSVSGSFTPNTNYGVNGSYTVGSGAFVLFATGAVTFGGTTVITNGGSISFNAVTIAATFSMTAPSNTISISGNFTTPGTFNNGGGTVSFPGTTNLSATEIYNNIEVTGAVTSTGNFAQQINGNLVNDGSFSIGTGTLTWGGSGTLSGTGNTTVGDLTVSGPSCSVTSSGDLTLNDDLLGTGIFTATSLSGRVIFAGAGSAINKTGSTVFTNILASGALTPTTAYSITGNMQVTGSLVSSSTVTFGGTTQSVTGTSLAIAFNNITVNVGSIVTVSPNITINGNLIGDGNISTAGTVTFVGLTMSGAGTKSFSAVTVGAGTLTTNSNYSVAGNLIINGTLAAGTGSVTFNGTTTVSGAGSASFNNLTITGTLTGRLVTEPVLTVAGDFTNSGIFNGSSGSISLGGNLINNGAFNAQTGSFSFNTTASPTRTITGTNSITFNNLVIFNKGVAVDVSNNMVMPASISIQGTLSFGENTSVFDADGAGSSVLTLLSTADSPVADGRIGTAGAGSSVSGNVTVQRFMSVEGGSNSPVFNNGRIFRYLSSPITNAPVSQLQDDFYVTGTFPGAHNGSTPGCTGCLTNPSLFSYDSSIPNYVAYTAGNLVPGRGYATFIRNDLLTPTGGPAGQPVVVDFTGPVNAGAIAVPLSATSSVWNLVGNPYPSPITWNNVGAGSVNVAASIAVRDNGVSGTPLVPLTVGNKIAAGQAFWVRANVNGASTLTFNEADKTTIASTTFFREDEVKNELVVKVVRSDTRVDETFIRLNDAASGSLDSYDIPKKNGVNDLNNDFFDLTSVSTDGISLLFNNLSQIACGQAINLNLEDQLENGTTDLTTADFTISINPEGAMNSITWMLHDAFTNADINLSTTPSYTFQITSGNVGQLAKNRFSIMASAPAIDQSLSLEVPPASCTGSPVSLIVNASQSNVMYGVEVNGVYYPNISLGNGGALSIALDNDWMNVGGNTVRVNANSGCEQKFLTSNVVVNKETSYQITAATNDAVLCKTGAVTLVCSASETDASFKWYSSPVSSTVIASGSQFVTPLLTDSTTYYVAAISPSGCEGNRVPVKVAFENVASSLSVPALAAVCKGEGVTLSATSTLSGGSFNWYDSSTGTNPVAIGAELSVPSLQSSKNFYVSYVGAAGCESDRIEVKAEVLSYTPLLDTEQLNSNRCAGNSQRFRATGGGEQASYKWFDELNAVQPLFEGIQFESSALFSDKTYYLQATSVEGCASSRVPVVASVIAVPSSPTFAFSQDQICNSGETTARITNPNPAISYRWYSSVLSTQPIHEGESFTTEALSSQTSYFVSGVNSAGCESTERREVVLQVTQFAPPLINANDPSRLSSNYPANNQWYLDNEELKNETGQFLVPTVSGVYDLKVNVNGCVDWAGSVFITTIVTGVEEDPKEFYVYPNPSSDVLRIIIHDEQPTKASLFDSKGSFVSHIGLTGISKGWEGQFDVKNLPKGLYLLQLSSGDKKLVHKVIIN